MTKIQDAIKHINEILENFSECDDDFYDDDDYCSFLSKKDVEMIKSFSKHPNSKWNSKMFCKAYTLLENNKENLDNLEVCFNSIEKPDFTSYELEQNTDLIKIKSTSNLELCNSLLNENFEKITNGCSTFSINITLKNIIVLIKYREEKRIVLSKNVLQLINLYINNVNHDIENKKLLNVEGYSKQLMAFQQTGVIFGLLNKRVLIADEMGLGKSIQALGILRLANAFKSIIVCPKSLKYKWLKEASCLDNVSVEIVNNKTDFTNLKHDIYIINYENVKKYIDILESTKEIKSVIFDESHYLKNAKTKRSKSCLKLARNVEYVIELTGSPVLNRPSELINQIDILGKLDYFGGYSGFVEKYCCEEKNYRNKYDSEEYMEANYSELSEYLRSYLYIRREKSEILKDLPPKQRTTILVDINEKKYKEKIKEYKNEVDKKKKKQLLENLKKIASHEKLDSIKERINNCIENKEKVVVFAYHRSMQEELINSYPDCLTIVSSQSEEERQDSAEKFQNVDDEYLIICSIKVAYYGFDLFAASQVLFAEMDWVPEINNQAEDRLHRIGQKNSVNVWYIIAKNTIEEKILEANIEKSKVINKINKNIDMSAFELKSNNIKDLVMKSLDEDL
jgi:SWI/SNF-related matrix-associated actin-dependent regulator 1 of chromatin subfamily A